MLANNPDVTSNGAGDGRSPLGRVLTLLLDGIGRSEGAMNRLATAMAAEMRGIILYVLCEKNLGKL